MGWGAPGGRGERPTGSGGTTQFASGSRRRKGGDTARWVVSRRGDPGRHAGDASSARRNDGMRVLGDWPRRRWERRYWSCSSSPCSIPCARFSRGWSTKSRHLSPDRRFGVLPVESVVELVDEGGHVAFDLGLEGRRRASGGLPPGRSRRAQRTAPRWIVVSQYSQHRRSYLAGVSPPANSFWSTRKVRTCATGFALASRAPAAMSEPSSDGQSAPENDVGAR